MTVDIEPVISTYMKREVADDQPAQIELHTHWEEWYGTRFYTTSVCDSKEYERHGRMFKKLIASVMFLGSPEDKLLDEHKTMVKNYRDKGYQIINEDYSPEMQYKLEKIKLENDNLEKLLKGVNISDEIV